jgi:hypothetical protein
VSSEGFGRLRHHSNVRRLLDSDQTVRQFFDGETAVLPEFYETKVRNDLGLLWDLLPPGALSHDHNAYLKSQHARPARAPAPAAARGANGLTPPTDLGRRREDQASPAIARR